MLCSIADSVGFLPLWAIMSIGGLTSMVLLSGALFYPFYVKPTFERWQMKINPQYPSPALVKKEIIHMCKGLSVGVLCPAFALVAKRWGLSQGYCGSNEKALPLVIQALIIFGFTDLFEYTYHWLGHRFAALWSVHRHHHKFYNPSPFAVIADEYLDQFVRSTPLAFLPYVIPMNMDLLFGIFAIFFYGYGVYLHWGYESNYLSAHHPIFNTSYHHYMHHAISAKGRPIFCGFFFKLWDNMFGSTYPERCICVECRPQRSKKEWEQLVKPDYSVLLSVKWWLSAVSQSAADIVDKNE